MIRDDWLMRQIHQLSVGLAAAIAGETVAVGEAELAFEHLFGAPPDLLASMSEGALLAMVRTSDGIDAARALALAVGLAQVVPARARALSLMNTAFTSDPELATVELRRLRDVLARDYA